LGAATAAEALAAGRPLTAANRLAAILGAKMDIILAQAHPELRLELTPAALGAIRIRLLARGEATEVRMTAEDAAVARLLEEAAPQLIQQFQRAGLVLAKLEIDAGGANLFTGQQAQKDAESESPTRADFEEEGDEAADNGARRTPLLHDGQVDLLV